MSDTLVSITGGNAGSHPVIVSAPNAKAGQQIISVVSTSGAANVNSNFGTSSSTLAFVPVDGQIIQNSGDLTGVNLIALLRG